MTAVADHRRRAAVATAPTRRPALADRGCLRRAAADGRARAHPVCRGRLPGRRDALPDRPGRGRRGRRPAGDRAALLRSAGRRGDPPAGLAGRPGGGRDASRGRSRSSSGSRRRDPGAARRRWPTRTRSSAVATAATGRRLSSRAGASGDHRRRPHPRRGRAVRGGRPGGRASPSSTSSRRRRRPSVGRRSPPARAASCTASRWSG